MRRRKRKKNKVNIIIIAIILFVIMWALMEEYKEKMIEKYKSPKSNYVIKSLGIDLPKEEQIIVEERQKILSEYKGYEVIAKLEIPKIDLATYVLKDFSKEALNVSVTRFWGSEPNEIGNFCIAGHNFKKDNMFHNLREITVGDKLFISENKFGRLEYEVYEIYRVTPENVDCLSQETNGKKEVTLITCTSDSKKRIIVKARKIDGKNEKNN